MKMIIKYSPNFSDRPSDEVSVVVLHATASGDARGDVSWCCNAVSKVSYHVIIDRDGTIYKLVGLDKKAWHAGVSLFGDRGNVNNFSIGLAFANKNDGVEHYTDAQYVAAAALIRDWIKLYPAITWERITTHAAIARPVGRKMDPKGLDRERLMNLVTIESRAEKAPGR